MLKQHPHFPDKPGFSRELKTLSLSLGMSHYAARVFGFLLPQKTASFTFRVAGDSAAEMYISDSDATTAVALLVKSARGTASTSTPTPLEAGKRYFFDVLFKQGVSLGCIVLGFR